MDAEDCCRKMLNLSWRRRAGCHLGYGGLLERNSQGTLVLVTVVCRLGNEIWWREPYGIGIGKQSGLDGNTGPDIWDVTS